MKQEGQILLLAVVTVGLVMVNTLLIIGGSMLYSQNANVSVESAQATNLAEAGVDKALASLNKTGGSYSGEAETSLSSGSYSVSVATSSNDKIITATGYVPNKTSPKISKTITVTASKGVGMAFVYGVQVGAGGLQMENNSTVNGSVYSNGSIDMENGARITGDAWVGSALILDQQSDCTLPNCGDFLFGTQVSGESILDVAQSFRPSATAYLDKISIKLKKFGSPPDITVRILADQNGSPDSSNVLASGTLTAGLVATQYGFADVTFDTPPLLNAQTPYWVLLDTSASSINYWSWSTDSTGGYTGGMPKWSSNWSTSKPNWAAVSGDLNFKTYTSSSGNFIQGKNTASIGGDAHANTILYMNVTGGAYYQNITGTTAGSYHPGSVDPAPKAMPVSDANIQSWKISAQNAGVFTGDISNCPSTLGPGKYVGNITLGNNCVVTITDPVWITGNLSLSNGAQIKLSSSYGATSGVVIVDGAVSVSNNSQFSGSGTTGSYLLVISTYNSQPGGQNAVQVENGSINSILYAPNGSVEIKNNATLYQVTAWKLELDNGVRVNYQSGLAGAFFNFGPSGAYSLIKGTYQIK